jgi:hypothetical protein
MTAIQLEGMKARAAGTSTNPYAPKTAQYAEWRLGYDRMEDQIRQALENAQSMLSDLEDIHRSRHPVKK